MANQPNSDTTDTSRDLFSRATNVIPGGVSHNVRYRDPYPIYVDRATGPHMWDVDGNRYVDFWNNHAASILGHSYPTVVEAIEEQVPNGIHYGAQNEASLALAERVSEFIPSAERVRFCMSGTEATMYAVRLARAWTGRDTVIKVRGGWHGGNTVLSHEVKPPFDAPTTTGLPPGITDSIESIRLDDRAALTDHLDRIGDDLAAIIVDPRRSVIPDGQEVLEFLSDERDERGYLLIFDEVVTGFRTAPGSYQAATGIDADLTTVGKVLGGGMPIGALAGRPDLFRAARPDVDVDPERRVLAGGGTFTDHPLSAVAGLATLDVLASEPVHDHTESLASNARTGLRDVFADESVDGEVWGLSSLLHIVFNPERPVRTPDDVREATDKKALLRFHDELIDRGYFFNPGSGGNVSYALTEEHITGLIDAAGDAVRAMRSDGVI